MLAPLRFLWFATLTLLLAVLAGQAGAQDGFKAVPELHSRVTDEIGMLTADQRQQLEQELAAYEAKTGNQIAVLLVGSTEPEAIEQYSIRVTDKWKLGRKGVDDGVLLLVARDNPKVLRRLRIEAGRGVQGVLTDAQSKRILQDVIAPQFRGNNYYVGLELGVGAIESLLDKETFPAPAGPQPGAATGADGPQPAPGPARQPQDEEGPGALVGIFMVVVIFMVLRSLFRAPPSRFSRGLRPGNGWGSVAGFVLGSMLSGGGRGGGGGGFSGGSSDGGGFSGGGGSFDGGGASGDW